jgi:hypothetical protein
MSHLSGTASVRTPTLNDLIESFRDIVAGLHDSVGDIDKKLSDVGKQLATAREEHDALTDAIADIDGQAETLALRQEDIRQSLADLTHTVDRQAGTPDARNGILLDIDRVSDEVAKLADIRKAIGTAREDGAKAADDIADAVGEASRAALDLSDDVKGVKGQLAELETLLGQLEAIADEQPEPATVHGTIPAIVIAPANHTNNGTSGPAPVNRLAPMPAPATVSQETPAPSVPVNSTAPQVNGTNGKTPSKPATVPTADKVTAKPTDKPAPASTPVDSCNGHAHSKPTVKTGDTVTVKVGKNVCTGIVKAISGETATVQLPSGCTIRRSATSLTPATDKPAQPAAASSNGKPPLNGQHATNGKPSTPSVERIAKLQGVVSSLENAGDLESLIVLQDLVRQAIARLTPATNA